MRKIPVILAIDVEPDERIIDRSRQVPWTGYEQTFRLFAELRPLLCRATKEKARFNWFYRLDPQISETYGSADWPLRHYADYLATLLGHGDEPGLHTHAYRWDNAAGDWVTDAGNQAWVAHCVTASVDAYRRVLDSDCRCFRFGDRWLNQATVDLLERLGMLFDLTLEPGMEARTALMLKEHRTGSDPDFTRIPRFPYRPSREDYRRPDAGRNEGLRMIPLSTTTRGIGFNRVHNIAYRLVYRRPAQPVSRLGLQSPQPVFRHVLQRCLGYHRDRYLTMIMRTGGPSPNLRHKRVKANIEYLLRHPMRDRLVFTTPGHALELLDDR